MFNRTTQQRSAGKHRISRTRRSLYRRLAPWALALAAALPSFAATRTVTNLNDSASDPGSLRGVIASAASGDVVQFSVTGTIILANPLTICGKNLTISGPGASQLAISGNQSVQALSICGGTSVTLSGLTIKDGRKDIGAGINNEGTLTLTDSTLSGNSASFGGGILTTGTLTVTNSTFSNNSATEVGGGIYNTGTLTVTRSTFSNNSGRDGGGIYNESYGTLTLTNSTLSANSATIGGGGIYSYGTSTLANNTLSGNSVPTGSGAGIVNFGTLTLTDSTLSGNSANGAAGIYNYGTLTVTNSTFSNNSATISIGGGIYNASTLTLTNTTLSGNSAVRGGGGIYHEYGALTVKSTLLANNTGNKGGNCVLLATSTSQGYNLSDDASCSSTFTATGDRNTTAAGLDPKGLQNNGGPTPTIALLPTSPAVDAIPAANCTDTSGQPVVADQRGITRPQGAGCDIGAFELVQTVPFSSFSAKLELSSSGFDLKSTFILGSGNNGIDPLTEPVTLQIGSYTATIPAGSFHQLQHGAKQGAYVYEGTINGAALQVQIVPWGDSTYQFKAEGSQVNLAGTPNPVPVTLTIGNDSGKTSVSADFE